MTVQTTESSQTGMDDVSDEIVPMDAVAAKEWRHKHGAPSLSRLMMWQWGTCILAVAALFFWTRELNVTVSMIYGAFAVCLPAAIFLRRANVQALAGAGAALLNLFFWELVKIVLTIALLLAAPRLLPQLHWPALLAGVVVAVVAYQVGLMAVSRRMLRSRQVWV